MGLPARHSKHRSKVTVTPAAHVFAITNKALLIFAPYAYALSSLNQDRDLWVLACVYAATTQRAWKSLIEVEAFQATAILAVL